MRSGLSEWTTLIVYKRLLKIIHHKRAVLEVTESKRSSVSWNKVENFHKVFSVTQNLQINQSVIMDVRIPRPVTPHKRDWVWSIQVNLTIVSNFIPDHFLQGTIQLRSTI